MNKAPITFVTLKGSKRTVLLYFSGLFSSQQMEHSRPLFHIWTTLFDSLFINTVQSPYLVDKRPRLPTVFPLHLPSTVWRRSFSTLMAFVWWLKRMLPSSARKASWRLIFHQHITTSSLSLCLLLLQHHTLVQCGPWTCA